MSRPKKERNICCKHNCRCFYPAGKEDAKDVVEIFCDELEAMKLINIDGMNMKEGGEKMGVSAPTFNRIANTAYKKVTDAIINNKILAVKKCE
ncbi:MAG TPA: DUF134 domain-containing protein [Candidatus Absconditabacterales bacterium]|nr:DUF134 domain-containing protein [Candidatus Absconditabacterales bacterium]